MARWTDPLVTVELLGHLWVPDLDETGGRGGSLHLEFMLKTVGDEAQGARLVQRRFNEFVSLHHELTPIARRAGVPLPPLPTSLTLGRKLSEEFAVQRRAALQQWISLVVARPPLWCDPLRLFLGLQEEEPTAEGNPFASADAPREDEPRLLTSHASAGSDNIHSNDSMVSVGGTSAAYSAELRWIVSRAQQPGCGVHVEGTGFFRASVLIKWLLVQALATSREQAVPLCEAMRRQGLIHPVNANVPFADGSALYRFAAPSPTVS